MSGVHIIGCSSVDAVISIGPSYNQAKTASLELHILLYFLPSHAVMSVVDFGGGGGGGGGVR